MSDETAGSKPSVVDLMRQAWKFPSKALADVVAERRRQQVSEGWTEEHDDRHVEGQMAKAASCYADTTPIMVPVVSEGYDGEYRQTGEMPRGWPWNSYWWKPKDRRRNLVRAAALIIAEIERLDRAAAKAIREKNDGKA